MELSRANVLRLMEAGAQAFRDGESSTACPYDQRGNREQQVGHRYWTRGYVDARENPPGSTGQ